MTHDQMKETMACQVCGKPGDLSLDVCYASFGKNNPLCHDYDRCRIAEKSEQQFNYAFSDLDKNIFLKACPGSGKTEVVGLKSAYEIKRWDQEVGGIAVLTFTNNAADVISERVSQFAGSEKINYPHFIGTFDRWLHGYIAHPFGNLITKYEAIDGDHSIRLVENRSCNGFLNRYKTQYNLNHTGNVSANQFHLDYETNIFVFSSGNHNVDTKRKAVDLKEWQSVDLAKAKIRFFKSGYATYQDIEGICFALVTKYKDLAENIARRFPLIIVDECQDLSWIQLQILQNLKNKGSKLHFVGDLNQAIYEFKKVDPEKVKEFVSTEEFEEHLLSDNFRSCQSIVGICQKIVNDQIEVKGICKRKLTYPCICLIYKNKHNLCKLPDWFCRYIEDKELDIDKSAIVTRGWSTVGKMRPSGNNQINKYSKRLAMAIHLWNTDNVQSIEDSITYMGRFFSEKYFGKYSANSRKHCCPECVNSGIQWRVFLMEVLEKCIQNEDLIDFAKTGTEWGRFVRGHFGQIARDCKPLLAETLTEDVDFPDFDGNSFRASDASSPVENLFSGQAATKSDIHITTIHSVKGQTLDSVMLVSAPSKSGNSTDNHWEYWLGDPTSEAARLAYVASSRPKHLLVWAVPTLLPEHINSLNDMGFTMASLLDTEN